MLLTNYSNISYSFIIKGTIDEPPVSPNINDQYLVVGAKPTSQFKDVPDGCIATYNGIDWIIAAPKNGDLMYNESDNSIMYYAYIDGSYKWSVSTKYKKNYPTNVVAKFTYYNNNKPTDQQYAPNACYFITFKNFDDDSIKAKAHNLIKVDPTDMITAKVYYTSLNEWTKFAQSAFESRAKYCNRFLCIDDGIIYKYNGRRLIAIYKMSPNMLYYDNSSIIATYDDKIDTVWIVYNKERTTFSGAPKTTRLDTNPPSTPKMGGLVKYELTNESAITSNTNTTSNQNLYQNWMFFKYSILHYSVALTQSNINNKVLYLSTPIASGKSGAKSMRLSVNGVTQIEGPDYKIENNSIRWSGLGMDQLGFTELLNNNKKVYFTMMYMVERKIKRD